MVGFLPHHFISIRWRGKRLIEGFLPHLSIRIKCREIRLKGDFPPHIFLIIWWVKDGLCGNTPTCLCQCPMVGKKVDGGFPPYFQNKMGEWRLIGGFLPHLWIRIRWGEEGELPPNLSVSIIWWKRMHYCSLASWDCDNVWFFAKSPQLEGLFWLQSSHQPGWKSDSFWKVSFRPMYV